MDASISSPRRSLRIIEQAKHQEQECPKDKRKRRDEERNAYKRIKNTFASGNDRESMLEQWCIHDRETRNALTEEEIERNCERHRIAYLKRRQQAVGGKIKDKNQETNTTGASTSATSIYQLDRVEGNLAITFSNLR